VKRNLLLAIISQAGAVLVRHGRNHDIYKNPRTGVQEPVARHNDIPERTAQRILHTGAAQGVPMKNRHGKYNANQKQMETGNRVGGHPLFEWPSSHTTVRTVPYTAVQWVGIGIRVLISKPILL
jgi:hypothetical protein